VVVIIAGTTFLFRDTVVNVAGGTVRAVGQLANGRWQASGRAVGATAASGTSSASVTGTLWTFKLSGTTESFKPETIRANGSGRVNIAGTVTASNIQLAGGRWQGQTATGIQLGGYYRSYPHNCRDASR